MDGWSSRQNGTFIGQAELLSFLCDCVLSRSPGKRRRKRRYEIIFLRRLIMSFKYFKMIFLSMTSYVCHVGFYTVRYVFRCQLTSDAYESWIFPVRSREFVLVPKRYVLMFKILLMLWIFGLSVSNSPRWCVLWSVCMIRSVRTYTGDLPIWLVSRHLANIVANYLI